jgi:hypothetical protein
MMLSPTGIAITLATIPVGCCQAMANRLVVESAAALAIMPFAHIPRRLLFHLVTALCLLPCVLEAHADPLYWQCSDQCEQSASLENKLVKQEKGGTISVWWSLNFSLGNGAVHSAEILTELDCISGQGRDRAILYFAAPNLAGGVQSFSIDNPWYVYTTQRFVEFLHHACQLHAPAVTPSAGAG